MALAKGHRQNFDTLRRAMLAGDAALLECQLVASGEPVAVICAANRGKGDEIEFVPFAMLFSGNPYLAVNPLCCGQHNGFNVAQSVMWPSLFLRCYFSVSPIFCAT